MALFPGAVQEATIDPRQLFERTLPATIYPEESGLIDSAVILDRTVQGVRWRGLGFVTLEYDVSTFDDGAITQADAAIVRDWGEYVRRSLGTLPTPITATLPPPYVKNPAATHVGYVEVDARFPYEHGTDERLTHLSDTAYEVLVFFGFTNASGDRQSIVTPATGQVNNLPVPRGGQIIDEDTSVTLSTPAGRTTALHQSGPRTQKQVFFEAEVVEIEPVIESYTREFGATSAQVVIGTRPGYEVVAGTVNGVGLVYGDLDGVWTLDAKTWALRGGSMTDVGSAFVTLERQYGA